MSDRVEGWKFSIFNAVQFAKQLSEVLKADKKDQKVLQIDEDEPQIVPDLFFITKYSNDSEHSPIKGIAIIMILFARVILMFRIL